MVWNKEAPKANGRFQWRANAGGRIHNVIVRVRGEITELKCKTMDLRQVMAGGEWLVSPANDAGEDESSIAA